MNPLQKRNNPFANPIREPERVEEEQIDNYEEEEEEIQPQNTVQRTTQPKKPAKKPVYEVQNDNNRVKYTSTMDRNIRRSIKILCAERGILFASFVEDACREKLRREGVL